MRKKIIFLIVVFLHIASISTFAQSPKKILKEANAYYQNKDYNTAISLYTEYLKTDVENLEAHYKLGHSYLQSSYKTKALPHLLKVYEKQPTFEAELGYFVAQAYHSNHQFEKAIRTYKLYKNNLSDAQLITEIDKKIKECEYGIEYVKNPIPAIIKNSGSLINTSYPEYVPVISEDESMLVFTSRRAGGIGNDKDPTDNFFYEDVYISYKKDGQWTAPKNVGRPINSESHDACIALSPDGKQIFVYKTGKGGMGDIYVSKFQDGKWSRSESLGDNINTKDREPSVSMSSDGKTIYFSSDRPGGFGGMDIYTATKNERGEWSNVKNLGAGINTAYDEDAPFIHNNVTLYFSSKGHKTMGGYDIFSSTYEGGQWSTPQNMGYPINTADDDIYFVLSKDSKTGYYASSQEGGYGEKDIYIISLPSRDITVAKNTEKLPTNINVPIVIKTVDVVKSKNPTTILKGTITDEKTKQPLKANITLTDLEKNELVTELYSDSITGKYETVMQSGKNYLISVQKEGYLFHSENFDIPPSNDYQEIILDVELKRLEIGSKTRLKVFYDFDKDELRKESLNELERLYKLLNNHPKLKVEISGHTDNVGTFEKNQGLSERRAKSVIAYLVNKGISKDRLRGAGYSYSKPIATNETDDGRQLNRRTECEIIGN